MFWLGVIYLFTGISNVIAYSMLKLDLFAVFA